MTRRDEISDQLRLMTMKAVRSLEAARQHVESENYDFASSRAYYAVFYMLEALLLTQDLSFSSHSAVISAFNKHFVKTSIFPKDFSKKIARLFSERQIGDYKFDCSIDETDAREDIDYAQEIVDCIREYLRGDGQADKG